jgi:hypothetical protein
VDVQIDDDEESYGNARAVDSDDDRSVAALSEESTIPVVRSRRR